MWSVSESFTMRVYGFLLTISLVLAAGAADNIDHSCSYLSDYDEYSNTSDAEDLKTGFLDLIWKNTSCFIYKSSQLNCSWSTLTLPADAYSVSYNVCTYTKPCEAHHLNCCSNHEGDRVECLGQIQPSEEITLQVKMNKSGEQYVTCNTVEVDKIEIMDPPEITFAIVNSTDLEIKWSPPRSINDLDKTCFKYELKINEEVVPIPAYFEKVEYTKKNLDLTRSYSIQIRARIESCVIDAPWSYWSESKVIGPSENPYQLNIYMIVSIAFVLPMVLLAFLLVCKFQRLSEKLFPSIPSPSAKVKKLLEKDDFSPVMPPKSVSEVEEGTEILQVTS